MSGEGSHVVQRVRREWRQCSRTPSSSAASATRQNLPRGDLLLSFSTSSQTDQQEQQLHEVIFKVLCSRVLAGYVLIARHRIFVKEVLITPPLGIYPALLSNPLLFLLLFLRTCLCYNEGSCAHACVTTKVPAHMPVLQRRHVRTGGPATERMEVLV